MTLIVGPNMGALVDGAIGESHYSELMRLFRLIDGFLQCSVISATLTTPPVSAVAGDMYIIPTGATGVWASYVGKMARYTTGGAEGLVKWEYITPKKGWLVHINDDTTNGSASGNLFKHTGTTWEILSTGGSATNTAYLPLNTQTGTTYTLVLTDYTGSKMVEMNNAAANTVTIPPNSSVAFPVGATIPIRQMGAGATTIVAGSGVTLRNSHPTAKIGAQYGSVALHKRDTDEWVIEGNLAAS